jgi:hypothetical protein
LEVSEKFLGNSDQVYMEVIIRRVQTGKTNPQLGYLHAEVLPKFYAWMLDHGDTSSDDEKKRQLKLHPEVDFCERIENFFTRKIERVPRSFSTATKEEMSAVIDKLVRLAVDFGIEISTPEEYYSGKNLEYFENKPKT